MYSILYLYELEFLLIEYYQFIYQFIIYPHFEPLFLAFLNQTIVFLIKLFFLYFLSNYYQIIF